MDWTGGSRRRYAGGKSNETKQKQKAHFARVRATLQQPTSSQRAPSLARSRGTGMFQNEQSANSQREESHRGTSFYVSAGLPYSASAARIARDPFKREDHRMHEQSTKGDSGGAPIEISSDRCSSSSEDSEGEPEGVNQSRPHVPVNDQEFQLLANRRRLLARSDWLGLAPAKPLRMEFPAVNDADQVGRRRKEKKPGSNRAKPGRQRLMSPVFEKALRPNGYMMSGALPAPEDHQVEIRIGTEAFASQSLRSRQSQTPANLSARTISTESALMSEESMLLGADGDTFDAKQVLIPDDAVRHRTQTPRYGESVYAQAGSQMLPATQQSHDMHHTLQEPSNVSIDRSQSPSARHVTEKALADDMLGFMDASSRGDLRHSRSSQSNYYINPSCTGEPKLDVEDKKTEELFRQFLGVPMQTSDRASRVALHSASQHVTTSESVPFGLFGPAAGQCGTQVYAEDDNSLQQGAAGQTGILRLSAAQSIKPTRSAATIELQSPSESLRMIDQLAKQRPRSPVLSRDQPAKPTPARDDDAVWRHFIIGSQDSDSEHSTGHLGLRNHELSSPSQPGSLVLSGLGTSQIATQGRSTFEEQTDAAAPSHRALASQGAAFRDVGDGQGSDTAIRGSALDIDSLEDERAVKPPRWPTNKNTAGVAVLNPKCFKSSTNRVAPSGSSATKRTRPAGVLPKGSTTRRVERRNDHDVYDIVDSDGSSLA